MRKLALFTVLLAVTIAGCRQVAVESDPGLSYALDVENATSTSLVVSYRDQRGVHELGTVRAGQTERFIVAGAVGSTVTVFGVSGSGTRTTQPREVSLRSGLTTTVRLTF